QLSLDPPVGEVDRGAGVRERNVDDARRLGGSGDWSHPQAHADAGAEHQLTVEPEHGLGCVAPAPGREPGGRVDTGHQWQRGLAYAIRAGTDLMLLGERRTLVVEELQADPRATGRAQERPRRARELLVRWDQRQGECDLLGRRPARRRRRAMDDTEMD